MSDTLDAVETVCMYLCMYRLFGILHPSERRVRRFASRALLGARGRSSSQA